MSWYCPTCESEAHPRAVDSATFGEGFCVVEGESPSDGPQVVRRYGVLRGACPGIECVYPTPAKALSAARRSTAAAARQLDQKIVHAKAALESLRSQRRDLQTRYDWLGLPRLPDGKVDRAALLKQEPSR